MPIYYIKEILILLLPTSIELCSLLASLIYGNSLLASVNMMDRIHFPIVMKVMKTSCRILIILVPTPTYIGIIYTSTTSLVIHETFIQGP